MAEKRNPLVWANVVGSKTEQFRAAQDARREGEPTGFGGFGATELGDIPEWADSSYVPGYSELRKKQDEQKGQGKTPDPLPARLQWGKAHKADNTQDYPNINIRWGKKKYQPATEERLRQFNWGNPPAATKGPDGFFYREGDILLICDRDNAIKNYEKVRAATLNLSQANRSQTPWVKQESETEKMLKLTESGNVFGAEEAGVDKQTDK